MKISVVMVVYNGAWCIEQGLDSLLAQARRPDEILVCDDGSTDGTPDLVERRYGDAVQVLRLPHRNASATRAIGVQHSTGDWIAFMDADDTWMPQKLERQLQVLSDHPDVRAIGADGIYISADGVLRESWLSDYFEPVESVVGDLFPHLVERCFPLMSSMMVERESYFEVGGLDPEIVYSHDYDLWLRVFARHPVALLRDRLVTYYSSSGALSRRIEARYRDDLVLMRRVQRGELGRRRRVQRAAAARAAALEFDLGLICLRSGRIKEARSHMLRATARGPLGRRTLALAGATLPGFALGGMLRGRWLKETVTRARRVNPRLEIIDRADRGAA